MIIKTICWVTDFDQNVDIRCHVRSESYDSNQLQWRISEIYRTCMESLTFTFLPVCYHLLCLFIISIFESWIAGWKTNIWSSRIRTPSCCAPSSSLCWQQRTLELQFRPLEQKLCQNHSCICLKALLEAGKQNCFYSCFVFNLHIFLDSLKK